MKREERLKELKEMYKKDPKALANSFMAVPFNWTRLVEDMEKIRTSGLDRK